jgi:hypothetical protein
MGGSEWSALIGERVPGNVYLSSSEARAVLRGKDAGFVLLVVVRPMANDRLQPSGVARISTNALSPTVS